MTAGDWVPLAERWPTEQDGDAQGCVLVWHELCGAMVYAITNIRSNSFITHWMKLPKKPQAEKAPSGG